MTKIFPVFLMLGLVFPVACGGEDDATIDTAGGGGSGGKGGTGGAKDGGSDASGGTGGKDASSDAAGGQAGSDGGGGAAGSDAGDGAAGDSAAGGSGGGSGGGSDGGSDASTNCDADGDGHNAKGGTCGGDDCDDTDKDVFPGQTAFFTKQTKSGGFDYNCSGAAEQQFTTVLSCVVALCPSGQGYFGSAPACGGSGEFGVCTGTLCSKQVLDAQKPQGCH